MTVRGYVARKYIVNLKAAEHDQLHANIHKGEHSAQLIMKARILLKADCSEAGEAWTDRQILAALECGLSTVACARGKTVVVLERSAPAAGASAGNAEPSPSQKSSRSPLRVF
jgi:hypothetical protein